MDDALIEVATMRRFAGISLITDRIPDETTILAWCIQHAGRTDAGTLASIEALAIDLRETGALDKAETFFRELVEARQQVFQPNAFEIGEALGELASTLEEAGKLIDAAAYGQQALDHSLEYDSPDSWWSNRNRLDLARILLKLERFDQAIALLDELQTSMAGIEDPDQDDQQLLTEAAELRASIQLDGNREN